MQKISKELLVFVNLTVPKKRTDRSAELNALLRRCEVRRLPTAVIADRYGNPFYINASDANSKLLRKQVVKAKRNQQKIYAVLEKGYERAVEYSKEWEFLKAVSILVQVEERGYVGLPVLKKMAALLSKINKHLESRLDRIIARGLPPAETKQLLDNLKAQAHRTLPVYKKIDAASEAAGT